jgi:hypothetical protein
LDGSSQYDKDERVTRHDPAMLFAILDEHLQESERTGNKWELARFDKLLYNTCSDLSVLQQMIQAIGLHRPKANKRTAEDCIQNEQGKAWLYLRRHFFDEAAFQKSTMINRTLVNHDGTSLYRRMLRTQQ